MFNPQPKKSSGKASKEPVSPIKSNKVVHELKAVVHGVVHSRHGKYADLEKRKVYRREWMRNRRANV